MRRIPCQRRDSEMLTLAEQVNAFYFHRLTSFHWIQICGGPLMQRSLATTHWKMSWTQFCPEFPLRQSRSLKGSSDATVSKVLRLQTTCPHGTHGKESSACPSKGQTGLLSWTSQIPVHRPSPCALVTSPQVHQRCSSQSAL